MRNPAWDAAVLDAKRLVARAQKCQLYQFCDSFANDQGIWDSGFGNAMIWSASYYRFPPPAGFPAGGVKFGLGHVTKNMLSNQATFIPKFGIKFISLPGSGAAAFFAVLDTGTAQWTLQVTAAGALAIYSGATIEASTGVGLITTNTWYGIELSVTVSTAGGTATVWVNGTQVINVTGIRTQQSANAYGNQIGWGDIGVTGLSGYITDLRVWDNTGATQNAPLGTDSRMITKMASGAGAVTQFTPNGAAANWQCTDEVPPDDDTTYVSNSTAGNADAYAMPIAGFTVAPAMVVARSRARKDDGATRALEIGVDSSGSIAVGSPVTMGSSYAWLDTCIALDPHTSAAWTAAGADAAQHYKVEST
jgi:hypothetical protein